MQLGDSPSSPDTSQDSVDSPVGSEGSKPRPTGIPDSTGSTGIPGEGLKGGQLHTLNFPLPPAPGVTVTRQLVAPLGHQLHLRLFNVATLASPDTPCLQVCVFGCCDGHSVCLFIFQMQLVGVVS